MVGVGWVEPAVVDFSIAVGRPNVYDDGMAVHHTTITQQTPIDGGGLVRVFVEGWEQIRS
jgi:hypothetical protein